MYCTKKEECKWCSIIEYDIEEKNIFLDDDIRFNNFFINSFLAKHLDKAKNYVVFYDEEIYLNNIDYRLESFIQKNINSCIDKSIKKEKYNLKTNKIDINEDTNIIFISTKTNFINLFLNVEQNKKIDVNFLFLNITLGAKSIIRIDKDIKDNSIVNTSWSSINCINKSYKDKFITKEQKINAEKETIISNTVVISNNNFLSYNSHIKENFNFGLLLLNIAVDSKYFSDSETKSKIDTKHLAFPVKNYVLKEEYDTNSSEITALFRGFYTKESSPENIKPTIDIEMFSEMKREKNNTVQDIKLVCEIPISSITVQPNLLAQGELQEGEHGYSFKEDVIEENSLFYLNTIGINKKTAKTLLLSSLALDVYSGNINSFLDEYKERQDLFSSK